MMETKTEAGELLDFWRAGGLLGILVILYYHQYCDVINHERVIFISLDTCLCNCGRLEDFLDWGAGGGSV